MKNVFFISMGLMIFSLSGWSQNPAQLNALLSQYSVIKDALVASDAATTGSSALAFYKTATAIDLNKLSASEQQAFKPLQSKLAAEANAIAMAKEVSKQRELFANLSANMIALVKATRLSDKELYVDYCAMKKTKWLSTEKPIKNPYYGNTMLNCGNIVETIK